MPKKILVVDDEPAIVAVLKSRLTASNYKVVTALDGEECLAKMQAEKPDLVILDLMMPKMDGYNVIITVKEMSDTLKISGIPIMVLTARGDTKVRELIEAEKVVDYVVKPFKAEELLEKIKKILGE
jgi:DNA-binding response OmpR family regulator